jgi:hypothetical protein
VIAPATAATGTARISGPFMTSWPAPLIVCPVLRRYSPDGNVNECGATFVPTSIWMSLWAVSVIEAGSPV